MVKTPTQADQLVNFRETVVGLCETLTALRGDCHELAESNPDLARRFNAAAWHLGLTVEFLNGTASGDLIALPVEPELVQQLYFARALHGTACERFIREGIRFLLRLGFEATDFGIENEKH